MRRALGMGVRYASGSKLEYNWSSGAPPVAVCASVKIDFRVPFSYT